MRAVIVRAALELQHLYAIQPVLDRAVSARHDARVLPRTDLGRDAHVGHQLRARQHIVERGQGAIAIDAELRVGVPLIVEDLVFQPERRLAGRIVRRSQVIEDSTVSAFRNLELHLQLEGAELLVSHDVAATRTRQNRKLATRQGPAIRRKALVSRAAPPLARPAIPQQPPALRLFLGVQVVRQIVADQDTHGRHGFQVVRLYDEILPRGGASRVLGLFDGMHLQADESRRLPGIDHVGRRSAVDPHAQARTDGLDAVAVPLPELVQRLAGRVHFAGVEPAALRLLVDAAAPLPLRGIYIGLVAVHTAILEFRRGKAAELHARVGRPHVLAHVQLENEVAVVLLRDEKAVGHAGPRGADDGAVDHLVIGAAAQRLPAVERLAVEDRAHLPHAALRAISNTDNRND